MAETGNPFESRCRTIEQITLERHWPSTELNPPISNPFEILSNPDPKQCSTEIHSRLAYASWEVGGPKLFLDREIYIKTHYSNVGFTQNHKLHLTKTTIINSNT